MKFLRNPIGVGLLAAVALAVAGWNVVGPLMGRHPPRARGVVTTPARAPSAPVVAPMLPRDPEAPRGRPAAPIEMTVILGRFRGWVDAPLRDPFAVQVLRREVPTGPSAGELLTLTAIWRQTGGHLAVINKQVLGEGEMIAGFKLERIEGDVVWVKGTNGIERVEFLVPGTPRVPGSDAVIASPAGSASRTRKTST